MLDKINEMSIMVYVSVTGFFRNLKEDLTSDERGISGIVVAVLLVLVAVLAVVMFWGSLKKFLGDIWSKVTLGSDFERDSTLPGGT